MGGKKLKHWIISARYNKFYEGNWDYSQNEKDGDMLWPEYKVTKTGFRKFVMSSPLHVGPTELYQGLKLYELPRHFNIDFHRILCINDGKDRIFKWPKGMRIIIAHKEAV